MNEFLNFTVIGVVTGAAYAIAASGLVVTYVTSGVFNIAQGAIGMVFAYLYWQLVDVWHWPILLSALVVVLVLAPIAGAIVEVGLIRRTAGQGLAITIVVTIALLVLLLFVADWAWGGNVRAAPSFFAHTGWHLTSKVFITWDETITIVLAGAVALFLRLLLYRTRVGIAMRAVVDNRELAGLNGARPAWLGTFSWALGAATGALAGILIAPILDNLSVLALTFLVIYAYGAAILGRLRSLPLTFLGAMVLGLSYSYMVGYLPQNSFFDSTPIAGLRLSLPVVMLFVVLLVMKQRNIEGLQLRAWRQSVDVPPFTRSVAVALATVAAMAVAVSFLGAGDVVDVGEGVAYGIIVLSLVPLAGWGGQVSLCQMTFAGLGAFAMAHVGGGSFLGLLAAIGLAGVVGSLVALPALRLRGLYLALATLAFAFIMDNMFFPTSVAFTYGGTIHVNRPSILGLHFASNAAFTVFLTVVFCLLAIGLLALRRGPFGRLLLAMKDSEAAMATLGASLTRTKLAVFTLSAAIAGLGGALFGAMITQPGAIDFASEQSLPILLLAVIFGMATTSGALLGGISYSLVGTKLQALAPSIPNLQYALTGLAGIGVGMNPDGTVPTVVRLARRWFSSQPAEGGPVDLPQAVPVGVRSADAGLVTGAPTAPLGTPVASGAGRL
ncbi:MAG TPA: ABC transporter permease [Acidimicrobiales bacterium]|nr:ABC transporter permease [Acidimicrobiales bacterium]